MSALVLHPVLKGSGETRTSSRTPEARLEEAVGLATAIGLDVAHARVVLLGQFRPAALFGSGKVEEIGKIVASTDTEVVIVDATVSPVQQRNLERAWKTKVIDRTGLILEIFGDRARTREGRMQVELAHLTYQRSRLVRSWTHLERQRGGFGFLGGPGESQLEIDRRIIDERVAKIRKQLETVVRTRELHRESRRKVPYPAIALVGYTNAGKSSLFNRLTQAAVVAEDMLFATLDPTMRELTLPSGQRIILSDTVGFISDLPTHLVAAFRATLEEVTEADLILHVRDISHPDSKAQAEDVRDVLRNLGIRSDIEASMIEVGNKIDLLSPEDRQKVENAAQRSNGRVVPVSAVTGEGCTALLDLLDEIFSRHRETVEIVVPVHDGATLAWLYRCGNVMERWDDEEGAHVRVQLHPADLGRLEKRGEGAYALDQSG